MIGLDTNVLVRYIMQDDARQAAMAVRLIESLSNEDPGFVSMVSIVELAWVLSSAYGLDRTQLVAAFEGLLRAKEIVVDSVETIWKALRAYQAGKADFADCLIERISSVAGCVRTMTFDRAAVRGCGMVLIE